MKFNKVSQDYRQLNMFIRDVMREKKISQESLAYSLNQTQGNISQKLSGKTDWTMWEILNVFEVLGIDFDYKEKL